MNPRIPEGMSSSEVFHALYRHAEVLGRGSLNPAADLEPSSLWNANQVFQTYCHNQYCDYVRGKRIKVNFLTFPKLNVGEYDNAYGKGAAQKAIDTYQRTIDTDSKEKYDLNCSPCKYFTPYWWEKTPEDQKVDLIIRFKECEQKAESEKRIEEQLRTQRSSSIFTECEAKYKLHSPPLNYFNSDYTPCEKALDHFSRISQAGIGENTNVRGLSICRYNRFLPLWKKCETQNSEISLKLATKILEAHTTKE